MAGKKDIVEQALKLIAGGAKEAAPKAAIRAYHVSPHDFDVFKPSEFRGSTFFSSTPERAKRGAEAGRNEMVMETATELPPVNWRTYEVEIDPSRVKGLSLTPSENKWFESLPGKIVGDDALAEATKGIPPGMYWDDFYDETPVAEGVYEYIKKPIPPSISYEDAISKNRDIYRKQWPHYAGAATDEKSSASRLNEQGMGGYLVQDEGGLSFAINDPSIVKILRKYANGGSIRQGYGPGGWVDDVVKMAGKVISGQGDDAAKAGIRAYQGSPHNFAAERLVRFPTGKEEYLVGQPDVLPDVPEGAEVLQDFPLGRMRMDKIGTGEGAQAYGHGLYLAEHEPVAQGYKDALRRKGDEITFDNKPIKEPRDFNAIQSQLENQEGDWRLFKAVDEITSRQGSMEDRLSDIRNWYRNQPEMLAAIDRAEKRMTLKENPGFVYETNINADPNTFLDWDKPLSEQPSLTRALGNYDPEYYVDYDEIIHKAMQSLQPVREPTGEDIYRALGHPKTATRMLNTMGVPGIRFLDAGSRVYDDTAIGMIKNYGSREKALEVAQKRLASAHHSDRASWQKTVDALSRPETRNLVVFDDKLISIIRKYGIAGASAMLGYNLMEQLDPKQALAASMADQDYQASRPQRSMGGNNSISGALNVARGLNGVK